MPRASLHRRKVNRHAARIIVGHYIGDLHRAGAFADEAQAKRLYAATDRLVDRIESAFNRRDRGRA